MKKTFLANVLVSGLGCAAILAGPAFAQSSPISPLQQAEMMDACDGLPVQSAELIGDGQLRVTCGNIAGNGQAGSLGGVGGILAGAVLIIALAVGAGGSSSGTN